MIKVECVSCKSPYDVDERRIPDKGMKMRCPKCGTSFMVARDGATSAVPAAGARPPLAPSVSSSSVSSAEVPLPAANPLPEKDFAATAPTEPLSPQVIAASLLNPLNQGLSPKAAAGPKLAEGPSAFSKTLHGAMPGAGSAPKTAPLGSIPGAGTSAKPAAASAAADASDGEADLPVAKPAARPAVPWGSLAPPALDAKPQPSRPGNPGGLPKGAVGGAAGAAPGVGGSLKSSSAGSAFGASGKQTMLGPARANAPAIGTAAIDTKLQPSAAGELDLQPSAFGEAELELADLPAPRGAAQPGLPIVDLPVAKSASDNAAGQRAKTPELPLVDLPAAKAPGARPIGQRDAHKPANAIAPEPPLEPARAPAAAADGLVDLPAPRAAAPAGARPAVAKPSAEQPVVDLPGLTGIDLPSPKVPMPTTLGAIAPAKKGPIAPDAGADLPAPKPMAPAPPFRAPVAKAAPPAPATAVGTASTLHGLSDLPAPKGPVTSGRGPSGKGEVDLPAPKGHADLPAPKGPTPGRGPSGKGEVDLPAPKGQVDLPARKGEVDLPAPKGQVDLPARKGQVDLPTPKSHAKQPLHADLPAALGGVDLPAPKVIADLPAALGGLDLPTLKGSVDLPTAKGSVDLPAALGSVDLPTPKGVVDLPTPLGAADLPTPKGLTDLPGNKLTDDGFGMLDLPTLRGADEASFGDLELPDLPVRPDFNNGDLPVPQRGPQRSVPSGTLLGTGSASDESSFGDLDLGGPEVSEDSFADVRPDDLVRRKEAAPTSTPPALQGDAAFGEAGLLGDDTEEDMEFGIDKADENLGLPPELLRRNKGEPAPGEDTARGKRALRVLIGVVATLVLVGGAGALLGFTDYGFFGVYYWEQYLPEAADARFARDAIGRAEKVASTDTYRDVQHSLALLGESRHKAGLNRELLTRSLLHESLFMVRFGTHAASATHVAAILRRLEERHNRAPGMDLGLAADAARRGDFAQAQRTLDAARSQAADDPYFALLEGEIALRQNKLADADKAFSRALKQGGAARAQWGLARVALARTDVDQQRSTVEETLKLSPEHVEARLAQARLLWNSGKQAEAQSDLNRALGKERVGERFLWGSKAAKAGSYSLLGYVQESRGHLAQARAAYDEALAADPYLLEALLGAGRVLLRERRWNDALARFESALNLAQKTGAGVVISGRRADVEARLGQSHAQLALNRAEDANTILTELMNDNPNDADVVRAAGQTADALGDHARAEELLTKSVELAPTTFASYLALAQHYFKLSRADKASETLNEAAAKVEENVEMRRMLGQSELARGRFDSAVHEFQRAVDLDKDDLDARFGLATGLRKLGRLDDARALIDLIAKRDPQYAGLALERGQLLEAQGQFGQAVELYRAAHAKDPSDTSLNLRLGAAQVEAGQLEDAELTLQIVMREMPNSAEAEYFTGRLALARGRGPDALTHFDRALSLDATQAVYHLYAARAALEMSNLGRAIDEAEATLERDATVGDAYWVRGIVRLRSGAVRDALKDAKRALELNPARNDANALLAECYDELRQLTEAAQSYHVALEKEPGRGEWWFKLGRLSLDRGIRTEAGHAFERAMQLGDKMDPPPYWLPDAYRLAGELARSSGDRKQAVTLFRRFLEIAPEGALDRADVRKLLLSWDVELER